MKRGPPVGPPGPKRGRYEQNPPHRVQKYPQNMQQSMHGPNSMPPQQQNFNNYHNNAAPQVQHPQSNYYGPPGNGNYDQSQPIDQYQNYNAPASGAYNSNGYSQGGYSQPGYQQTSEYDHNQYPQDYK